MAMKPYYEKFQSSNQFFLYVPPENFLNSFFAGLIYQNCYLVRHILGIIVGIDFLVLYPYFAPSFIVFIRRMIFFSIPFYVPINRALSYLFILSILSNYIS